MENQHRKISGYRELTQEEIDLMNEVKALGPQIEEVIIKVKQHLKEQHAVALGGSKDFVLGANEAVAPMDPETLKRLDDATPARWANMAATEFQVALMKLTRAVAQPTFF